MSSVLCQCEGAFGLKIGLKRTHGKPVLIAKGTSRYQTYLAVPMLAKTRKENRTQNHANEKKKKTTTEQTRNDKTNFHQKSKNQI